MSMVKVSASRACSHYRILSSGSVGFPIVEDLVSSRLQTTGWYGMLSMSIGLITFMIV